MVAVFLDSVRSWRTGLLAACLFATVPASAPATILEKLDFDTLCAVSDRVVVGSCTGARSEWDKPHRTILTLYSFSVSQAIKGDATSPVEVTTLGGIVGDQGMNVAGSPSFNTGEEYVLFLEKAVDGAWVCKGWTQGRYEIFTDPATGEKQVRGDTSGAALAAKGKRQIEDGRRGRPMRLTTFLESVRSRAQRGGK